MNRATIVVLQVVIAIALVGSVAVQTLIAPLLWLDLAAEELWGRIFLVGVVVLGVRTMQVFGICVWMLLGKVRRGSIFSKSSFRYVNVIIGAILTAAALALALAIVLAPGQTAPGIVGLVCGASLVLGGMALLMVVMKALLRQAIERETEAQTLRSELDNEVI
ncbi:DUF2975 domain-containing protein [Microbacterium sp. SA39]|uniref:DUF2975 domain-containing protein n=1 Tax=Microbacterium sp. SA39 TaxID=1263625 RepID=UPI0005FA5A2E|nr:DUF2975 domain-containing protein [Microbacterium sp. SA39]KJQ54346.1 hypothetical protein RS85_01948 [Microbacterium sp. SA39]